jgi:hypothetical protein
MTNFFLNFWKKNRQQELIINIYRNYPLTARTVDTFPSSQTLMRTYLFSGLGRHTHSATFDPRDHFPLEKHSPPQREHFVRGVRELLEPVM